jgi:glycosyltransferase involved in cell wall biosynthesis
MRILKVIHGFPPDYMAGSEIYSYHLVKELINQNIETFVFTRVENEFHKQHQIYDEVFEGIPIQRVNKPKRDYLYKDKFFDDKLDVIFKKHVLKINPDVVHLGHLSHLSTNLIKVVNELKIPIVYTIHDFWLFCVKGQLINKQGEICSGPSIEKCNACSPYVVNEIEVEETMGHMKNIINSIDVFVSPSHTLRDFFIRQGVEEEKIKYLKYGFNTTKIKYNKKIFNPNSKINFGFMGRVIPTKGIKVLVDTFNELPNEDLFIYGGVGAQKRFLETKNVTFKGGYDNNTINDVLNEIDVLIVPSTWYENAPLVIQEAFLAGIPVVTSDLGGMSELVNDQVNGFTFKVGSKIHLKEIVSKIASNPTILNDLKNSRSSVVSIEQDANEIIKIYQQVIHDNKKQ